MNIYIYTYHILFTFFFAILFTITIIYLDKELPIQLLSQWSNSPSWGLTIISWMPIRRKSLDPGGKTVGLKDQSCATWESCDSMGVMARFLSFFAMRKLDEIGVVAIIMGNSKWETEFGSL